MKTFISKRHFYIIGLENCVPLNISYSLNEILEDLNDTELMYSLQENLDNILDLNTGEALTMYSNRDNQIAKNLIIVYRTS